jgi:hypothetical protein
LIRVRQELDKRFDRLRLPWRRQAGLARVLDKGFLESLPSQNGLRAALSCAAGGRFPANHLTGRAVDLLPARDALLDHVERAASGAWVTFSTPTAVDINSIDWTRHPVNGVRAAPLHWTRLPIMNGIGSGDVKFIWEINRHAALVRLAQGYCLTGEERLVRAMLRLLDQWIEQNPPGRGVNWTSSLEVAFRSIAWCWIWGLTHRSAAWDNERVSRFLVSLWHHARHIERFDSIHHSPNTHLTGEGLALLYVGLVFPELRRAQRWARLGREILETEIDAQTLDDGMHFERAIGYQRYTTEFYLHFLVLADAFGLTVDAVIRQRIHDQFAAVYLLRRPDGTWPVIGDEDGGSTVQLATVEPQDQSSVLALGGAYFDEPDWIAATAEEGRAAGWWLLGEPAWTRLASFSAAGHAAGSPKSGALTAAGYFVGRESSGVDAWWCLVDGGPHGGNFTGHAHTDLGHVEIAHGSSHIVVDPGCPGYTVDLPMRDWTRSERAHACLVIENSPLAESAGPFAWRRLSPTPRYAWSETPEFWWCEIAYEREHRSGQIGHVRQVVLIRGHGVLVADWLTGDPLDTFAIHWPLGENPFPSTPGAHLDLAAHRITWCADGAILTAHVERMVRSPGYGRREDGVMLRLHAQQVTLPAIIVTRFAGTKSTANIAAHKGRVTVEAERSTGQPLGVVLAPGVIPATVPRSNAALAETHR